jgi:predicted transcriptional regulator
MAKKLGNGDKLRVQELLSQDKSLSSIAKDIGVTEKVVSDYLLTVFESQTKIDAERKKAHKEATKEVKAGDLMLNKTRDKKAKGVSIMTREASEVADKFKDGLKTDKGQAFQSRYAGSIGKINEE